jgi:sugar/nucleoside kinase (ribokinase family)
MASTQHWKRVLSGNPDMGRIVATGSMAFDSVTTPFGSRERALGGSANYFSLSASYFAPVGVVGVVGEDYPQDALKVLSQSTVDISGVVQKKGETFFWAGEYGVDLNEAKTLSTRLNVFSEFNPVLPDHYLNTEFLFLANADPDIQQQVIDQVRGKPFIGADTMNFWISGKRDALLKTLKQVDLLTINEGECHLLAGSRNLVEASRIILEMGPKILVVKRGEYGSVLFSEEQVFTAPAYPLEKIMDPTGAGDTFAGGMMGYLAHHGKRPDQKTLRESIVFGTVMASFVVENFSFDRMINLTGSEIQERYKDLENMTNFHHGAADIAPKRDDSALLAWVQ